MCDNNIYYTYHLPDYYNYNYNDYYYVATDLYCGTGYSYVYESCCYSYYYDYSNAVTGLDIFLWCLYGFLTLIFLIILICCCIRRRRQQ